VKPGARSLVLAVVVAFMVGFGVPVVWSIACGRLDVEVVSKRSMRRGPHGTFLLESSTAVHVSFSGHGVLSVPVSGGAHVHRVRGVHGVCRVQGVHGGRVRVRVPEGFAVHRLLAGERVVFVSRVGFDGARRFV
jgi:hypothetical protein